MGVLGATGACGWHLPEVFFSNILMRLLDMQMYPSGRSESKLMRFIHWCLSLQYVWLRLQSGTFTMAQTMNELGTN